MGCHCLLHQEGQAFSKTKFYTNTLEKMREDSFQTWKSSCNWVRPVVHKIPLLFFFFSFVKLPGEPCEHPVVRCRLQEERAHRSHSRQSWGWKQAPDAPSLPQALSCSCDPYPEEAFYVKRSWFWKVTFASEDSGEEEKHCFQL